MAERGPRGEAGLWQRERQCGDCGNVDRIGRPLKELPDRLKDGHRGAGPNCTGYYNGRPGNRCGWPISETWVFYPTEKLRG